ncbi:MAG: hypothetical protein CMJ78_20060 [Planctomycetaceae bacterium]|nr:hypothetical protein [Planctomycetaceae bacterium]
MKLLELKIENYGIYADRSIQLNDSGFQVIYGPNEAGKSTLLQLIRELLFGFAHQNPYDLKNHSGKLAAIARCQLRDGNVIKFRRQKGRTGTVNGEFEGSLDTFDDIGLRNILGAANADLYKHVFGFSLKELESGEQSLKDANLNEAMFGSGLGGLANFQSVQQTIQKQQKELFSKRASKPVINKLLTEIQTQKNEIRELSVKPRDYEQLNGSLAQKELEGDRLRERVEAVSAKKRRLGRLETALDKWTELRALREQLQQLGSHEDFPVNGIELFQQCTERLDELNRKLADYQRELDKIEARQTTLKSDPAIMAEAARIRQLLPEVGRIRGFLQRIPEQQERQSRLASEVQRQIAELNSDWTADQLKGFLDGRIKREVVSGLAQEVQSLNESEAALSAQRPDLERRIAAAQQRLREIDEANTMPAIEEFMQQADGFLEQREQVSLCDSQLTELSHQLQAMMPRLAGPLEIPMGEPTVDDTTDFAQLVSGLAQLPLPLAATIAEFRDRLDQAEAQLSTASESRDQLQTEIDALQQQLDQMQSDQSIPDRSELEAARELRNTTWHNIRTAFVDGDRDALAQHQPKDAASAFEHQVADADEIADQRQALAEEVARREQLTARLVQSRQQMSRLESDVVELQQKRDDCWAAWRDIWASSNIEPLSVREMQDWHALYESFREKAIDLQQCVDAKTRHLDKSQAFEQQLLRAFPTKDLDIDSAMAAAKLKLAEFREHENERKQHVKELPDLEARLKSLNNQLCEVTLQRGEWSSRWEQALGDLGFPTHWDPQLVTKMLNDFADFQQKHVESESLRESIEQMQTDVDEFSSSVLEVCRAVANDLVEFPVTDIVEDLDERLQSAKDGEKEAAHIAERSGDIARDHRAVESDRDQCQEQLAALFSSVGVDSDDEFLRMAREVEQHRGLIQTIENLQREISVIRGNESEAEFVAELDSMNADRVHSERLRLEEESKDLEDKYRKALGEAGTLRHRIESMNGDSQAAATALQLESSYAKLGSAVDRWAPLVLTQALMARALQRFEQEHQPELLHEVSRLLKKMTLGRYVGLHRKLDDVGTLLIEQHDGSFKEPSELSTGTREQLYLAIRLAFVSKYCHESEPLPIVMDDVLVNFDEERVRSTLETLLEFSRDVQILFLTCHQHMVEMAAELEPTSAAILLAPGRSDPGKINEREVPRQPIIRVDSKATTQPNAKRREEPAVEKEASETQSLLFPDQ